MKIFMPKRSGDITPGCFVVQPQQLQQSANQQHLIMELVASEAAEATGAQKA